MSTRLVTIAALMTTMAVAAAGWSLAQSGPAADARPERDGDRFAVVSMGESAVMVETRSGKTWVLFPSGDGRPGAWLPTTRIDDRSEAEQWLEMQRHIQRELDQRRERAAAAKGN
ncbi:MAG: hypothetical protein SFX72_04625 [Isosphaeraceae bacterium]|nr:hypothetical protein [Isosphaeraceae bacterium]